MKLYVYCLVERVASIAGTMRGVSGARVRLLEIGGLAALVSELEIDVVPISRENILAHATVVRSVMDRATPLPFRFGTLVTDEQLSSYISSREPALGEKLAHVRDCVEMSVKIIWKPASYDQREQTVGEPGPGTAFLAEKRQKILGDERRAVEANAISTWLQQSVSGLTRDELFTVRPSDRLMLAASHLVERSKLKQYREQLVKARKNRPELHFLMSGPWPPYTFVNIELEFKSQFGVS